MPSTDPVANTMPDPHATIANVDLVYFTTNLKLTDEWAICVLEAAAAKAGSRLVFHLNTTEIESEIPCPDCHEEMHAHV